MSNMTLGCKAFYKLIAVKCLTDDEGNVVYDDKGHPIETGETRVLADWFGNTILNNGRNRMGTSSDWFNACQVGTDNTAPTPDNTGLLGYLAGTSTVEETQSAAQGSEPYYGWKRKRFRFTVGTTAGNLNEVGVGWGTSGSVLASRALIVDIDGNQTTVTPLADEILDVWCEFRIYPPLIDVTGTVDFNGEAYNYTIRASQVTQDAWGDFIGDRIGVYNPGPTGQDWVAYDGTIGTILQAPNGTTSNGTDNPYNGTYSNNSYENFMYLPVNISGFNFGSTGFRSVRILTKAGYYQTEFSRVSDGEKVLKTNTSTMTLTWKISWRGLMFAANWNMVAASDSTTPTSGQWNTNLAGTLLRISWEDDLADSYRQSLVAGGSVVFRMFQDNDKSKWVEYTTSGASVEQASWTQYTVTQTGINNGGPTVGQLCYIKGEFV